MVANKGFKEKEIMCNFVNSNEVVKLLKKHVESIKVFYIWTIYFYTGWNIKVFSSIGAQYYILQEVSYIRRIGLKLDNDI